MQHLTISLASPTTTSDIFISGGISRTVGELLRKCLLPSPRRIAIVSNRRVFGLYGDQVVGSLKENSFAVCWWLMGEGEQHKSFASLEAAENFLARNGIERDDVVVALGGGVVGDLAGFSAAVYLRGIRFVQIPTTLLAQIDSSVGGKTAINLTTGKNLVGAFHQPRVVAIDLRTLSTLPKRELVAGFCEMVKQSIIADAQLFRHTTKFLQRPDSEVSALMDSPAFEKLIAAHCKFKASIVAGDERESTARTDGKSRKILNFGHTTAHALESVTRYRMFRHGEAVGYGVLVAGNISQELGLLSATDAEALRSAISLCGPLPAADKLDVTEIMQLVQHDKKSLNGEINWVLLEKIGSPVIVKGREVAPKLLRKALQTALRKPKVKKV